MFYMEVGRSKMYFAALVSAELILGRMAECGGNLPCIMHGMTESYYQALLNLKSITQWRAVWALIDSAPVPTKVPGDQLHALIDGATPQPQPSLALSDVLVPMDGIAPSTPPVDVPSIHRIARQILTGLPTTMVDVARHFDCAGTPVKFDNCSHATGHQRGWVKCPHPNHAACFKYAQVRKCASATQCVAWLADWSRQGRASGKHVTKGQHAQFQPSNDVVLRLMDDVTENDI